MEHKRQCQYSNSYECNNTGILGSSVLCGSVLIVTCNNRRTVRSGVFLLNPLQDYRSTPQGELVSCKTTSKDMNVEAEECMVLETINRQPVNTQQTEKI
jgi:hypothetical protein